jgi:hypothetical protein
MAKCYKEKERQCDSECAAYCEEKRHGIHCLALAVHLELEKRVGDFICSSDINSYFLKALSMSMDSLKDTVVGMMK